MKQADLKNERRRFERVDVDPKAGVFVTNPRGARQGELRQLGRGGFLITTNDDTTFKTAKKQSFIIVDPHEDLNIHVHATFCYFKQGCAGFEFDDLDADAAVKIGILIGKYYVSDTTILQSEKR
jgi:hypothetical protein